MKINKEFLCIAGTYSIAINSTAAAFKLKPVEMEILLTCYMNDVLHKENDTYNIAFRLGKKKENYLYKFVRGLETKGYLISQQAVLSRQVKGRIAKCYQCTNKAAECVEEFFIQSQSYGG